MLTFMEEYVWANLGWVFCEISFRCPEWLWPVLGHWTNTLGNWFYDLAFTRFEQEHVIDLITVLEEEIDNENS